MVDKLVDSTGLERLAQKLDERSKNRADELQSAVDDRIIKPSENGVTGQILSISDNGSTQWIDNVEAIDKEEFDAMWNEVFEKPEEVEEGYIDTTQIKLITKGDIDNIMGAVF